MELQTRLVFIDTSAYEIKKLQFGHFVLGRLQQLVEEKKFTCSSPMWFAQK